MLAKPVVDNACMLQQYLLKYICNVKFFTTMDIITKLRKTVIAMVLIESFYVINQELTEKL